MGGRVIVRLLGIAVIGGSALLLQHQSSIAALVERYRSPSDHTSSDRILEPTTLPNPMVAERYATAKRLLYDEVFPDHRVTLYCACRFDAARRLDGTCGSFGRGERAHRRQRVPSRPRAGRRAPRGVRLCPGNLRRVALRNPHAVRGDLIPIGGIHFAGMRSADAKGSTSVVRAAQSRIPFHSR